MSSRPTPLDVDLGTASPPAGELDAPGPDDPLRQPGLRGVHRLPADELVGATRVLQGDATDRAVLDGLRAALPAGRSFEGRAVNYRADGTPFIMSWRVSPVRDATGAVTGYVSIQEDVTEPWMAELRVHERLSALQELIAPPSVPVSSSTSRSSPCRSRSTSATTWVATGATSSSGRTGGSHLVVGDVTGHGVIAAMQIGRFRWALRALLHTGTPPERAIRALGAVNPATGSWNGGTRTSMR